MSTPEELRTRIEAFKKETTEPPPKRSSKHEGMAFVMRMIVELAAAIITGWLVGGWLDKQFDTAPWLLILCICLSAIAGFLTMIRLADAYQKQSEKTDKEIQ